jgi:hypothetical protein
MSYMSVLDLATLIGIGITAIMDANKLDEPGLDLELGVGEKRGSNSYPPPPPSQISQGDSCISLAGAARDPAMLSKPQKNNVLFGCPDRPTGRFPA